MSLSPDRCPPDPEETAEQYVLGRLSSEDAMTFEDHFVTCPECARVVEETDMFVRAIRAAAKSKETSKE